MDEGDSASERGVEAAYCRTGPLRAGRSFRDLYTRFAVVLLLVGARSCADQRGTANRGNSTKWSPPAKEALPAFLTLETHAGSFLVRYAVFHGPIRLLRLSALLSLSDDERVCAGEWNSCTASLIEPEQAGSA